ncbi:MAG: tetratricopeptide repeat protein [Bacteroidota bacterium]|nr:tetratricopeptide repeat protein [Bacteroidota bacterium]
MKKNLIWLVSVLLIIASCGEKKTDANDTATTVTDTTPAGKQLEQLNNKIAKKPGDAELLHERAKVFIQMKRFQDALTDMTKVMTIDSTRSVYFLTMADLSFAANRSYEAKTNLEKAIALDPENTEAMMRLAELNLIVRQYAESVKLLTKIIEKDKTNTTAWFMRGMNFKENGDTTRAISDFRSAIEADPDYYNAYMQLGILYQIKNDPIAEGYFSNAIKLRPGSEEALYGRGLWYQDHNNLDKAIQDYTTIVQLNPQNKNAHFNLGYIHQIYLKVYPEAIKHYAQAILADPRYAEAYYNRALCLEAVGNKQDAATDFKIALNVRPGYTVAEEGLNRVSVKK